MHVMSRDSHRSIDDRPMRPAVESHDLRMRYGDKTVLEGVDLTIAPGEVVALLGPNGAGKTTTIEVLEGFRRRSYGTVRVLGVDPDRGDERWQARMGVVLQSWRDHRRWKVRQLLHHMAAHYRRFSIPGRRPYDPDELLELVGLTAQAEARVGQLSGGQRRRLDVAIGLVGNPELLFLDEPTVGFDPEARQLFHDLIRSISRDTEMAIILTTHDLGEAELLADSVAILVGGRIVVRGTTAEIAHKYAWGTQVSYRCGGLVHTETVTDATSYVREVLTARPDATDLVVRPLSLHDAYLQMIRAVDDELADAQALTTIQEGPMITHAH